jgi:hypothetical protein
MKTTPLLTIALVTFSFSGIHADNSVIYLKATDTEELKAKDGQKVTVHGETAGTGKSSSGTNFVNFKGGEFYLITFKSDLHLFPEGEPADLFGGKRLAVTGVMSIYQGKPQFKLTSPDQVRILEAGEEFPPKQQKTKVEPKPKASPQKAPAPEPKPEEESKPRPPVDSSEYFK